MSGTTEDDREVKGAMRVFEKEIRKYHVHWGLKATLKVLGVLTKVVRWLDDRRSGGTGSVSIHAKDHVPNKRININGFV